MNIDIDRAHTATIKCWRTLLRRLNSLNSTDLTGGKHNNVTPVNFIEWGAQHPECMDRILEFMLSDISMSVSTREEIFLNNVEDIVPLQLLKNLPDHVIEQHDIAKNDLVLQQLRETLKQFKHNILMLDDNEFERPYKHAEIQKRDLLQAHILKVEAEINPPTFALHPYMDFVCHTLIEKSRTDCMDLINASQRTEEKLSSEFDSFVRVHVEDTSKTQTQSHPIGYKKSAP